MATGPEHYAKSEDLVARLDVYDYTDPTQQPLAALQIAEAQVHATLALAAATALGSFRDDDGGMSGMDCNKWVMAASGDPDLVGSAESLLSGRTDRIV